MHVISSTISAYNLILHDRTSLILIKVVSLKNGAGLLNVKKNLQKVPATRSNKPEYFNN